LRNSGQCERIPQDANIGVAMRGNALESQLAPAEFSKRIAKREVVHCISAIEQRSVNIEQVSMKRVPWAQKLPLRYGQAG
jgi:hypothetical protein